MAIPERVTPYGEISTSREKSSFEQIAESLDSWIDEKEPDLTYKRYPFDFRTPTKIEALSREESVKGEVLSIDVKPPNFPKDVRPPHIVIVDTPENAAVSLGRLKIAKNKGDMGFELARYHTGYPAQKDMAYAARQAMQVPEVHRTFTQLSDPEEEAFIVYLAREGPMVNLHGGIYNEHKLNIPYTTAHARHEKADNKFGRRAEVCDINFEGLNPSEAKVLIVVDNTASGAQHDEVITKAIQHIEESNHAGTKLERIMVVSPLLTRYGALELAYKCAEWKIPTDFVGSEFWLDCIGPKRYFSPVPDKDVYAANPKMLLINRLMLRELVGGICSRCNWTASFSAARAALKSSAEELSKFGVTNEMLMKRGEDITPELLLKMGIRPRSLIPYSSLTEAKDMGFPRKFQDALLME